MAQQSLVHSTEPSGEAVQRAAVEPVVSPDASAFWASVFGPDGMTAEQVRDELNDYHFLLEQVPKVYDAVSGGRLSKTNYHAGTVITEFEDYLSSFVEDAAKEARAISDASLNEVIHQFDERAAALPDDRDEAMALMRDVCRAAIAKAVGSAA